MNWTAVEEEAREEPRVAKKRKDPRTRASYKSRRVGAAIAVLLDPEWRSRTRQYKTY
jgi:hypothetical protein